MTFLHKVFDILTKHFYTSNRILCRERNVFFFFIIMIEWFIREWLQHRFKVGSNWPGIKKKASKWKVYKRQKEWIHHIYQQDTDSVYWVWGNKGIIRGHIDKYNVFVPDKQESGKIKQFTGAASSFWDWPFAFAWSSIINMEVVRWKCLLAW